MSSITPNNYHFSPLIKPEWALVLRNWVYAEKGNLSFSLTNFPFFKLSSLYKSGPKYMKMFVKQWNTCTKLTFLAGLLVSFLNTFMFIYLFLHKAYLFNSMDSLNCLYQGPSNWGCFELFTLEKNVGEKSWEIVIGKNSKDDLPEHLKNILTCKVLLQHQLLDNTLGLKLLHGTLISLNNGNTLNSSWC